MESFEDLQVWQEAKKLQLILIPMLRKFPSDERYRLVDQLFRASRSITANIVEGFGRSNHGENIQFCRIARGSLSETLDHIICALDNKYIDSTTYSGLRSQVFSCWRLLNGYISYLKRAQNKYKK